MTAKTSPVGRDSVEPTTEHRRRENPATGVYRYPGTPTIVFLTVCSFQRTTGLANDAVMRALVHAWKTADAWIVGHFVLMPDHLHLFCAPQKDGIEIEHWISFWKRELRRALASAPRFQSRGFHHRLRKGDDYEAKLIYVLNNPVRAQLVSTAEDWLFRGKLNHLPWQ